jgi:Cu/Ag efflux pump CusA
LELKALPVPTSSGGLVRLGDVARPRFDLGPGLVRRENVERVAMVTANIMGPISHGRSRGAADSGGRAGASAALVGGVFAVELGSGVPSVAFWWASSLCSASRPDGVLLVSHYQHLMTEEGLSLAEAVSQGASERLAPVLMTALIAGLALIPLVLAGGQPGNEIQSPDGAGDSGGAADFDVLESGAGAICAVGRGAAVPVVARDSANNETRRTQGLSTV